MTEKQKEQDSSMERKKPTSGPGTRVKRGTHPQLDASGNGELEKTVKFGTGARRRGGMLRLCKEPNGEEPVDQKDTEI